MYNKLHAQRLHSEYGVCPPYNQPWQIHYQQTEMDTYKQWLVCSNKLNGHAKSYGYCVYIYSKMSDTTLIFSSRQQQYK